ncbi:MAG: hypothetical protein ACLFQX_10440, partial [Candidatus Kapaibacterium sp.]
YYKNPDKNQLPALFGLSVLIPVISTYGWEYAYVLAAPVFFYALIGSAVSTPAVRWLTFAAALMYLFPKPPDALINKITGLIPDFIITLALYRYIFGAMLLTGIAVRINQHRGNGSHKKIA